MADNNGSPGISKLARVLSERAGDVASNTEGDRIIDFGEIQDDMSCMTATFPIAIPEGDYHMTKAAILRELEPGDSVLVAWVGNDLVIVDKLT